MKIVTDRYDEVETTIEECSPGSVVFWKGFGFCIVTDMRTMGERSQRILVRLSNGHSIRPEANDCVKPVVAECRITLRRDGLD